MNSVRDDAVRIGKRFITEFQRDDVPGLAAELAYRFLFAIFPFGIFVAALTAFVAGAIGFQDPTGDIMGALGDNLPPDLAAGVRPQLEAVIGQSRPGLLTIGAVLALWSATGGTNALIKAMNRAWEVEETRPFLTKLGTAIGLTLLASVGILVSFVTIVGASLLSEQVASQLGLQAGFAAAVGLARWPAVFILLSVAVAVLYHWAPNFRAPWRVCLAGGALFSVLWIVATWGFSLYVSNFANYANTYGALGGVIALMLWFYLSAMLLVAAAAIMAAALKELQPTVVDERRVERGVSPARQGPDAEPHQPGEPQPPRLPAPVIPHVAVGAMSVPSERPPRRPIVTPRRRPVPQYRMSGPEDWAVAGAVTAVGATVGAMAAWLLGSHRRS